MTGEAPRELLADERLRLPVVFGDEIDPALVVDRQRTTVAVAQDGARSTRDLAGLGKPVRPDHANWSTAREGQTDQNAQ